MSAGIGKKIDILQGERNGLGTKSVQTDIQIWKIYLDTCCLSRFFDDQTQPRVRRETQAVGRILENFRYRRWEWIASSVLEIEAGRNLNVGQCLRVKSLLARANQSVLLTETETSRGSALESLGFKLVP